MGQSQTWLPMEATFLWWQGVRAERARLETPRQAEHPHDFAAAELQADLGSRARGPTLPCLLVGAQSSRLTLLKNLQWLPTALSLKSPLLDLPDEGGETISAPHITP